MGTSREATSVTKASTKYTMLTAAVLGALALVGCNQSTEEAATTADTEVQTTDKASSDTVTIYSSRNEQLIQPLLDEFTKETGIPVELVTDDSGPLIARLQAESTNTPADILLTVDAGNL